MRYFEVHIAPEISSINRFLVIHNFKDCLVWHNVCCGEWFSTLSYSSKFWHRSDRTLKGQFMLFLNPTRSCNDDDDSSIKFGSYGSKKILTVSLIGNYQKGELYQKRIMWKLFILSDCRLKFFDMAASTNDVRYFLNFCDPLFIPKKTLKKPSVEKYLLKKILGIFEPIVFIRI